MLFKQRKPRRFSYRPDRTEASEQSEGEDIRFKWRSLREERGSGNVFSKRLIVWIIALGMIIVLWYILGKYQN